MFVIVYSRLDESYNCVYARIYNQDGTTNKTAFIVSNNGTNSEGAFHAIQPSVTSSFLNGYIVITWI